MRVRRRGLEMSGLAFRRQGKHTPWNYGNQPDPEYKKSKLSIWKSIWRHIPVLFYIWVSRCGSIGGYCTFRAFFLPPSGKISRLFLKIDASLGRLGSVINSPFQVKPLFFFFSSSSRKARSRWFIDFFALLTARSRWASQILKKASAVCKCLKRQYCIRDKNDSGREAKRASLPRASSSWDTVNFLCWKLRGNR